MAIATGCLELLQILFEELTDVNVESGIDIRKRTKDEGESLMSKNEITIKKRTPLQLACAMGVFKIVEYLLTKGANPNGVSN